MKTVSWIFAGRSSKAAVIQTLLFKLFFIVITTATGITTARTLGSQGRGELAAITMCPQFLSGVMTLGLPPALLYNLKLYDREKSKLFAAALIMAVGLSIFPISIGILIIPSWLSQYSSETIQTAQWFMAFAPPALLIAVFAAALESEGEFTIANQARYFLPLFTLIILINLARTNKLTPITAGLAYVLPSIPLCLWLLVDLWHRFCPSWTNLSLSCQRLMSYGLRAYIVDLLGTLPSQVDQFFVAAFLTPNAMGIFVVAYSFSGILYTVQSSFVTVLLPKTAARPVKEIVSLTGQITRISLVLSFLTAIAIGILSSFLVPLLYGAEFIQAMQILPILLLEMIIRGTVWVLAQPFMASNRPGTVTIAQGISLGLGLFLMLLLIPKYGLIGAGIALLVSSTLKLFLTLISYSLVLNVSPPKLLLDREDWLFVKNSIAAKRKVI
jgi:antigen flippase